MQPRCVIFDETTSMLDPAGRRDVLNRMADLNRMGMTILFITHFMEEVPLAKRVLLLDQGKLKFDGTPAALFANTELIEDSGLERPAAVRLLTSFPDLFQGSRTLDRYQFTSGSHPGLYRLCPAAPGEYVLFR